MPRRKGEVSVNSRSRFSRPRATTIQTQKGPPKLMGEKGELGNRRIGCPRGENIRNQY